MFDSVQILSLTKNSFMRFIPIFVVLFVAFSCSSPSSKVMGKWKLEEIDYSDYFAEAPSEVKSMMQSQMQEEFERLRNKTFFEFSDGEKLTLEAPNFNGKQTFVEGTWSMNKENDSLFFDLSDPEHFKIISLTENDMVLSTDETPKRKLRLSKVN